MTEEANAQEPKEESTQERSDWASDAEEALEGVGDALREAWEASRDARLNALESAKKAAQQLGEAIDHGVAAAKEKWEAQSGSAAPSESSETPADHEHPHHAPQIGPDEGRTDKD